MDFDSIVPIGFGLLGLFIVNEVYNKTKLEKNKMEYEFMSDQELETPEQEEKPEEETVETQDDSLFNPMEIQVPAFMQGL